MAILLPARRTRVLSDGDHAPDMGALARDLALGLADPPRIHIRRPPDERLAKDRSPGPADPAD